MKALRHLQSEIEVQELAIQVLPEVDGGDPSYKLPSRTYVTTAGAVYDCEQYTVSANQITTGLAGSVEAGQPVGNCAPGWNCTFELAIVRCAREKPTVTRSEVKPPKVEDIELDTKQADADAAVLTRAVESIAGPGWDQYGTVPASIQFGEVEGGLFAVILSITLNLWNLPHDV